MTESDRHLLCQVLALCPFVDDPSSGIAKMREVIARRRLRDYDLRELITALGESRSNTAVDLLSELASDPQTFGRYEDNFINAFAALDTPSARALLLGFVDPDVRGLPPTHGLHREDVLVVRVGELAQHRSEVAARLRQLCEHDLPASNRHFLSKVMFTLGTHEDLIANLNLIDDARSVSIPQGVRDQIERAFVERQPYRQNPNIFTVDGRASNELRAHLFKMVHEDRKRQKSALMLLGQIEYWRLQYGRPTDELRHPDLPSRQPWPPTEF